LRNYLFILLSILFIFISGCDSSGVKISNAWVREVPEGISTSALYLTIKNNNSENDSLLSVETGIAGSAEIHQTSVNENGISYMKKLDELDIPSSETVSLEPGGTHIMLIGINRKIKDGDEIKAVLRFRNAGNKEVTAVVRGFKKSE